MNYRINGKEDKKKPKFEDIDISDLVGEEEVEPEIVEKKSTKREKLDKKRKIEDYLDEHLPLNVSHKQYALIVGSKIIFQVQRSVSHDIRHGSS